jgi:hypothetical protein
MPFYSLSSSGGLVEAATFAALPATGATGTLYVVTGTNTLYRWSGSAYVEVSASPAEVVEAANLAAFPATGATGKIYVALDTGKTYRWGGSAYAEISASDWATITGKPSTFAPSAHGHAASEITGLAAVATTGAYADVSGKPSTFAPSAHAASHASGGSDAVTLAASQVTGLQTALDGKAAASHPHSGADITSGTIGAARLPAATTSTAGAVVVGTGLSVSSGTVSVSYGSASGSAAQGNDSRLSDARTPTSHAASHAAAGADPITVGTVSGRIVTTTTGGKLSTGTISEVVAGQAVAPSGLTVSPPNVNAGNSPADLIPFSITYDAANVFQVNAVGDVGTPGLIEAGSFSGAIDSTNLTGTIVAARLPASAREAAESFIHPFLLGGL